MRIASGRRRRSPVSSLELELEEEDEELEVEEHCLSISRVQFHWLWFLRC